MKSRWWVLALILVSCAGAACADTYVDANGVTIDRDKLWNPFVGYAPWEAAPTGYAVAPAPAQATVEVDRTAEPSAPYVAPAAPPVAPVAPAPVAVDRDRLWNPFCGETPWLDPVTTHLYSPRQ